MERRQDSAEQRRVQSRQQVEMWLSRLQRALEWHLEGISNAEVARRLGVTRMTVYRLLQLPPLGRRRPAMGRWRR
jgi:DNA-binding CsgD family transcriptional regulator